MEFFYQFGYKSLRVPADVVYATSGSSSHTRNNTSELILNVNARTARANARVQNHDSGRGFGVAQHLVDAGKGSRRENEKTACTLMHMSR
jgi:hypothetical protein